MKKQVLIFAGIVVVAMSGLTHVALSESEDSQWTPYVLRWDQKLSSTKKKKKRVAKINPIPVCSAKTNQTEVALQR